MKMLAIKSGQIFSRVQFPVSKLRILSYHNLSIKSGSQKDISKILCVSTNLNQRETLQRRTMFIRNEPDFKPMHTKDEVDSNCELIYKFERSYMYITMAFHTVSLPCITYSLYDLVLNYDTLKDLTFMHMEMLPHLNAVFCFGMCIYFNKVMRQYMHRIYYDAERDMYIGIYSGWNFQLRKIEFKPEDCDRNIRNPTSGMWQGNIRIKKQRFSISDQNFKYGRHFESIFGFKWGKELIKSEQQNEQITQILKRGEEHTKKIEEKIQKKFDILKKMIKKNK